MSDVPLLEGRPEVLPPDVYRRRLEAGHIGLCAKIGGVIAGYNWACFERACFMFGTAEEWTSFPLAGDTAFLYDFFVFRDFRGRGLGRALKRRMFETMRQRERRYALFSVYFWNTIAIRLALQQGCEPLALTHQYRIGSWRKFFWGTRAEADRLTGWCRQFREA